MKFIAFLFFIAEIEEKGKVQAFYERPLSQWFVSFRVSLIVFCVS